MTSVKKRLDHVLCELENLGIEADMETAGNIVAELKVIHGAYRETRDVPMCCFRYDSLHRIVCDVEGPLDSNGFMARCRECQIRIRDILVKLKTD